MIAHDKGFFTKHGIKAKLVPLKSGKEVKQAISLGQIDIGSGGATNFFVPISKGAPVKIIAPSTTAPTHMYIRPDGGVKKFRDLIGKTIATTPGSSSNFALLYALSKENINTGQITFVDVEKKYRPIALMEKKIVDAAMAGEHDALFLEEAGAVPFPEWQKKGYLNKQFPHTVIAVNTDFLATNPEKAEAFIDAFIETQSFIKSNPDEAAELLATHISSVTGGAVVFSPEDIKEVWKTIEYNLWDEPDILVDMSKIAKETGEIEKELTLDEIYDLQFRKKLKDAQAEIYGTEN